MIFTKNQNTMLKTSESNTQKLKLRILETEEELNEISEQWDELVDISESTVYQKSYWLFTWWKYYNNPKTDKIFCLVFYDEEKLIGIVPLYLHKEIFFNKTMYKRLYFIGSNTIFGDTFGIFNDNSPTDYFDIISHPQYEMLVTKNFLDFLVDNQQLFDEIILTNLYTKSVLLKYLPSLIGNNKIRYNITASDICPYVQIPESFEDFLNSRTPSVKRRFSQSWKEAKLGKLFKIEKPSSYNEFMTALESIKVLHQTKWNRVGFPGFFGDERYEKFFYEFLEKSYNKGIIWCAIASNNERVIAGRLAFKYKNKFYDYLSGIDDTTPEAKRRPGLALLMEMINEAIQEKIQFVDLLRGDEPYKKDFTSFYDINWNLKIYKKGRSIYKIIIKFLLIARLLKTLFFRELSLIRISIKSHKIHKGVLLYLISRIKAVFKKLRNIIFKRKYRL